MPIELNLTPEQKAALADLFRNYNFVYQNGKLQKWPKVDEPIIVENLEDSHSISEWSLPNTQKHC